ncbi:hypothetical protein CONPUDRAFT_79181, partial [Coniophora puteana RWD-64-598 SS2]
ECVFAFSETSEITSTVRPPSGSRSTLKPSSAEIASCELSLQVQLEQVGTLIVVTMIWAFSIRRGFRDFVCLVH